MPRESLTARRARAARILDRLESADPDWEVTLDHEDAFQLLVATMLSAQSTDAMVNSVTPALFAAYPDAAALAAAPPERVEALIRSCGYFRQKARHVQGAARDIIERFGGRVPDSMDALTTLPGVGRKTANVVLHTWYKKAEGVCVDTHVRRLSLRLGLTKRKDPVHIEQDLMHILPVEDWQRVTHLLIDHGRSACTARSPGCGACAVADLCPSRERPARYL